MKLADPPDRDQLDESDDRLPDFIGLSDTSVKFSIAIALTLLAVTILVARVLP